MGGESIIGLLFRLNVWDRGGGGSGHRMLGRDVGPRWYRVED